ncbi:MAG: hypothetical protein DRH08_07925, partial [Deltaproteobacteria bacterium]
RLTVAKSDPDAFVTCAAYEDEKLRGYAFTRIQHGAFGSTKKVAVLDAFGVAPEAQGRGIAKSLLAGIEHRLHKKGITTLRSEINWANHDLIRFFSATHFCLAPIQMVTRDTSSLSEIAKLHDANDDKFDTLSRDRMLIRSLEAEDLDAVVRIDQKLSGHDRSAYYRSKFQEMLIEAGVRVSLVAEKGDMIVGFIMARVDYGEFGKPILTAVTDTIGVHPSEKRTGVGLALLSQLLTNLSGLQVESLYTQIEWKQHELHEFLQGCGFIPSQHLVLTKEID